MRRRRKRRRRVLKSGRTRREDDEEMGSERAPGDSLAEGDMLAPGDPKANSSFLGDASGAGLSFTSATGWVQRIGSMCHVTMNFTFPVTASGSNAAITLPFTAARSASGFTVTNFGAVIGVVVSSGGAVANFFDAAANTIKTNVNLSGRQFLVSLSYPV